MDLPERFPSFHHPILIELEVINLPKPSFEPFRITPSYRAPVSYINLTKPLGLLFNCYPINIALRLSTVHLVSTIVISLYVRISIPASVSVSRLRFPWASFNIITDPLMKNFSPSTSIGVSSWSITFPFFLSSLRVNEIDLRGS